MLEGLAAWVLKTYIGKYVNVNPDRVSVGLLSGVVELENVQLNAAAFNNDHEFPFELKCGYAGKIKLNVSLSTLRYSPWVLAVDELFIVIGPKSLDELTNRVVDETQEAEALRDKLDKLNNAEAKWFKEVELLGLDDEAAIGLNRMDRKSKLASLLMPMIYSLLNNIHVSLNKLHIRYEDATNGFSVDADIESIEIKNDTSAEVATPPASENNPISTDDPTDSLSFKLFELKNCSVYTTNRILFAHSEQKLENLFETVSSDRVSPSNHEFKYLIEPTAFKAQLVRDLSPKPLRKRKKPRIRINTVLNDFNVNINEGQLKYFGNIVKFANIYKNALACMRVEKPNGTFLFQGSSK
jgi:vacuolar protein sorting-associated protein 13D